MIQRFTVIIEGSVEVTERQVEEAIDHKLQDEHNIMKIQATRNITGDML